jgi:ABC-type amino acid transport substrate-binding protein
MDGKVSGLYSEIIQEIANANNWQVEYVYGEFSQLLDNLQAGKIDLMTAVAFTEERAKIIDYNRESVILNWGVACSKKQIDSFLDLDNKIIAVVEKDVYADYLERQAGDFNFQLRFFVVEDYEEALKAVKDGLADIAIVSRIFAAKNAKRYSLKISGVVFSPVELRFAFPKGAQQNHVLTEQIDNYLSSLKSDSSRYNTLIARYLGTYVEEKVIPRWLSTILILSIFGVALLALWIISLRKIVQRRTQQLEKIVSDLDKKNEELTSANEEIRAQDQEIRAINEELEKTLEDLEISIRRLHDL